MEVQPSTKIEYETMAIEKAIEILSVRLNEYSTTLEEDTRLLSGVTQYCKYYYALLYRIELKSILSHQIYLLSIAKEIIISRPHNILLPTKHEKHSSEFTIRIHRKMINSYLSYVIPKCFYLY